MSNGLDPLKAFPKFFSNRSNLKLISAKLSLRASRFPPTAETTSRPSTADTDLRRIHCAAALRVFRMGAHPEHSERRERSPPRSVHPERSTRAPSYSRT